MTNNDTVGFCKPPKHAQWKKGISGNSKGRPKGAKNLETVVRQEAYSKISLKEGGKTRKVSKVEALFKSMMARGIQGNTQAANIALSLLREYLPQGDPNIGELNPLTDEELEILSNYARLVEVIERAADDKSKS